jgi:hypothetical protein
MKRSETEKKCECHNESLTHADLLSAFKGIGCYEFVVP